MNFRHEYELMVVPGRVLNESITPIIKTKAKDPPVLINIDGNFYCVFYFYSETCFVIHYSTP